MTSVGITQLSTLCAWVLLQQVLFIEALEMDEETFTEVTTEEDLDSLAVQYLTLKEEERILKRNVAINKKKIEDFLDENKMYHAETCTHHITRTVYDVQSLLNKEEFQRKYSEDWVKKNCKNSTRSMLKIKKKD